MRGEEGGHSVHFCAGKVDNAPELGHYTPLEERRQAHLASLVIDETWEPLGGQVHRDCGGQAVRCPTDDAFWGCVACRKVTDNIITEFVSTPRAVWKDPHKEPVPG